MKTTSQPVAIIVQQLTFCPPLPTVLGSAEFIKFCALWHRINELLQSVIEKSFVQMALQCNQLKHKRTMTYNEQAVYQLESQRALRCTMARILLGEHYNDFACHLAESAVLQQFCLFRACPEVTVATLMTQERLCALSYELHDTMRVPTSNP